MIRLLALGLSLILLVGCLSGCSMVPYYSQVKAVADTGIATAVQDRKEFNDKKLAVSLAAICDSSIGAVNRLQSAEVRDMVQRLCGGDAALSASQIVSFMNLFDPQRQGKLTLPDPPTEPLVDPEE